MIDAWQKEFRVSLEAAEVDSNEVSIITVIVDGTSSKRSYKTNSNAFSGVSSTGWNKMILI
jgi:flagellar basal body rod protein FlgC